MKLDKKTKTSIFLQALLTGLGSVVIVLAGYPQLVYLMFAGFTVANCCEHKISTIPNMLASEVAGWFWAMLMFYACNIVAAATHIAAIGFFVAIFIGSILLIGLHVRYTMGTWFNFIPIMYLIIFCWFSVLDMSMIPHIILCVTLGMILAAIYEPILNTIFKEN